MAFFFFKNLHKHQPARIYDDLFVFKKNNPVIFTEGFGSKTRLAKKSRVENCHESKGSGFFVFPRFHQFWQTLDGKQTVKEKSDTS